MSSASDPNSRDSFTYNGDSEVTSVDNAGTPNVPHVVLASGYDLLGDRTSLSATIAGTADFANTYQYDGDQNLTMVQQQGVNGGNIVSPKEIDYGYNALGQFTSVVDFNYIGEGPRSDVLTGTYGYDNGARLTGIAYTSNGGTDTIDTLGWGYDPANNVTSFSSIDGTAAYGYDPTNQLTSATYTTASGGHQPANESFSFDLNGNRNSTGYTTGSDNLLTSDGTFTYQHDADGNTTVRTRISNSYASDYETTYTWDYRNRLTDVEYYDNNDLLTKHVHYAYDVFDHLITTEVDPTGGGTYTDIQRYALDVSPEIPLAGVPGTELAQPELVFDGKQNLIQRNLVALDPAGVDQVMVQGTVISLTQGDNDMFVADDNLGTPRDDTNGTGTLVNHKVFSVYGQDVYDSNSSIVNWSGFGGGHTDPNTGLVNDYHRWYNPTTGTWESPDPSGFSAHDLNLQRYAGNSPMGAIDLAGLSQKPAVTPTPPAGYNGPYMRGDTAWYVNPKDEYWKYWSTKGNVAWWHPANSSPTKVTYYGGGVLYTQPPGGATPYVTMPNSTLSKPLSYYMNQTYGKPPGPRYTFKPNGVAYVMPPIGPAYYMYPNGQYSLYNYSVGSSGQPVAPSSANSGPAISGNVNTNQSPPNAPDFTLWFMWQKWYGPGASPNGPPDLEPAEVGGGTPGPKN